MKKITKTILKIATMATMLVCAYLLGTTHTETVIETQKVIETVEVIPDGYIGLNEAIPLEDVACWFMDGYDYPCFELKDACCGRYETDFITRALQEIGICE